MRRTVIAAELAEAVATVRVVADEPPQLVTRSSDGTASTAAAELIAGNAAAATDQLHAACTKSFFT